MATNRKNFQSSTSERRYRRFSESFKREKVNEILSKKCSVSDICKAYEVTDGAVYKWIDKYSNKTKPERTIVESKSDTTKILALQKKIADLERALGQKQVLLDFQIKLIEMAEEHYKIDIKKKSDSK